MAVALVVDGSGNVYVTGSSEGSGTGKDYATVKYDASGNQQWVARYNGPGNGEDAAVALVVDGSGNVYVTGYSVDSGTGVDYATVKYDANGNQQWVARYNGPGNGEDVASALALDSTGKIYVTGALFDSSAGKDYATVKYNLNGNEAWVARYNGPGNGEDVATALVIDSSDKIYVTGSSVGSNSTGDYTTVKYGGSGNQIWVARHSGPDNGEDEAIALTVDGNSNVYVVGSSQTRLGTQVWHSDYATVKYSPNGNQQWVARYNGPDNGEDRASAVKVDSQGNAYVTGYSKGTSRGSDYATIKYDSNGNQTWVVRYDVAGQNDFDTAIAVFLDNNGNVYVAGSSVGTGTGTDFAVVKYTP